MYNGGPVLDYFFYYIFIHILTTILEYIKWTPSLSRDVARNQWQGVNHRPLKKISLNQPIFSFYMHAM